ncbi:MAG: hypothetical protein GY704_12960 [Phycisphaeraceae bacterium]|nr:hypothetical protein [Phycisphaeraceae bacterium]
MDRTSELLVEVDRLLNRDSGATPGWADPHPNQSPADDEYSRVTNSAKWRIVGAWADAWLNALAVLNLARIERDVTVEWIEPPSTVVTRLDRAVPRVPGALPLVLARSRIEDVDDAGVTIGVGEPAVVLALIPDCGCDACDSGSQDALDELDEYVLGVVTGQFRRLHRGGQTITVTSDGSYQGSGINGRGVRRVLADPAGWDELTGPSWMP